MKTLDVDALINELCVKRDVYLNKANSPNKDLGGGFGALVDAAVGLALNEVIESIKKTSKSPNFKFPTVIS